VDGASRATPGAGGGAGAGVVRGDGFDRSGRERAGSGGGSINGTVLAGESGATLDLGKPGNGDAGDRIAVEVFATDGHGGTSAPVRDGVTVAQPPPTTGTGTPPAAGAGTSPPAATIPSPSSLPAPPASGVAGVTSSRDVRELRAARTLALRTLARRGMTLRLIAPAGSRVVEVRLYRLVPTGAASERSAPRRVRVLTAVLRIPHDGRVTVRWRPRRADVARLRSGSYAVAVRAGRDRAHLAGRPAERPIRLTGTPPPRRAS
jgi:hypothetical protein